MNVMLRVSFARKCWGLVVSVDFRCFNNSKIPSLGLDFFFNKEIDKASIVSVRIAPVRDALSHGDHGKCCDY